jgi:hypothetical protein
MLVSIAKLLLCALIGGGLFYAIFGDTKSEGEGGRTLPPAKDRK